VFTCTFREIEIVLITLVLLYILGKVSDQEFNSHEGVTDAVPPSSLTFNQVCDVL